MYLEKLIEEVNRLCNPSEKESPIKPETKMKWGSLRELVAKTKEELGLDDFIKCEVSGCPNLADYEGWVRCTDPVLGTPTGLIQRRNICEEHKMLLIGFEKETK